MLLANSVLVETVLEERNNISNLNVGTATGSAAAMMESSWKGSRARSSGGGFKLWGILM